MNDSSLLLELTHSNLNNVTGNMFLDSYGNASLVLASDFNVIAKSEFNGTADFDLILMNGTNNRISENTFIKATFYNLLLLYENGARIEGNYFLSTPTFGFSQALDSGTNNIFLYNFWNGWTTPDQNHDGIVDYPFAIDGFAHNSDPKPLASDTEILATFLQPLQESNLSNTTTTNTSTTTTTQHSSNPSNFDAPLFALVAGASLVVGMVIPVAIRKVRK